MRVVRLAIKRVVDVAVSVILLVSLSPLLLIVGFWILLDSPGPALFISERVGRSGKPFQMVKFRSMVDGAHLTYKELRESKPESVNGVFFKDFQDERITRLGRFLRVSSIDELPQLWNVLMGDMSLVGPRPAFALETEKLSDEQRRRLSVKPGLTGLWQVSGRSSLPGERAIELDLYYVENASLWLDLKILAKTIPAVLSRRGAF